MPITHDDRCRRAAELAEDLRRLAEQAEDAAEDAEEASHGGDHELGHEYTATNLAAAAERIDTMLDTLQAIARHLAYARNN